MNHSQISRVVGPEERELDSLRLQIAALETELAEKELCLITLKAELDAFNLRYMQTVGPALAKLDEIRARIQEALAALAPHNQVLEEQAYQARQQADETAQAAEEAQLAKEEQTRFHADEGLKSLFRRAAKKLHPDLADNEEERDLRTRWMAEVNAAYSSGDTDRLQQILKEWDERPEMVIGDDHTAELERLVRRLNALQKRIVEVTGEYDRLIQAELYHLWHRATDAKQESRDLLAEMLEELNAEIEHESQRLHRLVTRLQEANQ